MPITFKTGNMFDEPTDAIVNTVNTVGVMGAGVALEFKKRWPDNFKAYKKLCDAGELRPGILYVHDNGNLLDGKHRYLINLPTKVDWRNPSKIEYVSDGLDALIDEIHGLEIKSITIPALGCGNGGLDWDEVKELIVDRLQDFDDVDIVVYEPSAPQHKARPAKVNPAPASPAPASMEKVTFERALLLKSILDLQPANTAAVHDIVDRLQRHGARYGMTFEQVGGHPHSAVLDKALASFASKGLTSMGDTAPTVTTAGLAIIDTLVGAELLRANQMISVIDEEWSPSQSLRSGVNP